MDIRKGDTVLVITGKYKGRKGRVLRSTRKPDCGRKIPAISTVCTR